MDIEALEYSENQQCFHFNIDTTIQKENTNSYVTIAKYISYEKAVEFVHFVEKNIPVEERTPNRIKTNYIIFIQNYSKCQN